MVPAMALIVRRVIAEGGRVQGRIILQHRQEALAIITSFLSLSNGGLKGLIRSFIRSTLSSSLPASPPSSPHRKVKRVQAIARDRLRLNFSRLGLLAMVFERAMKILFSYVGLMVAGKVAKTIEPAFLHKMIQRNDPSVIRAMISLDYFTKFSHYLSLNPTANKLWRTARQDSLSGKFETDPGLRERLLFALLITLRHRHIAHVIRTRVKKSDIPLVVESDVREFIHGGKDPLHDHMVRLDPIESLLLEFQEQDTMSMLLAQHQRRNVFPPFLLFHTLTTSDVLNVCCSYVEKAAPPLKGKKEKQLQLQPSASMTLGAVSPVPVSGGGGGGAKKRQGAVVKAGLGTSGGSQDEGSEMVRAAAPVAVLAPAPPQTSKPSGSRRFRKLLGLE
jgi:hypothetical protein